MPPSTPSISFAPSINTFIRLRVMDDSPPPDQQNVVIPHEVKRR